MARVDIKFTREGYFKQQGRATVDVDDPYDWDQIEAAARRMEFTAFLPLNEEWDEDTEWEFDPPRLYEVDNDDEED